MRQERPVKHPHALGGPLPVIAVMEALLDMDTTRDVLKEAIDDIVREERQRAAQDLLRIAEGIADLAKASRAALDMTGDHAGNEGVDHETQGFQSGRGDRTATTGALAAQCPRVSR